MTLKEMLDEIENLIKKEPQKAEGWLEKARKEAHTGHTHCWHPYTGVIHMVVPDGHIVVKCCSCPAMETRHRDHFGARPTCLDRS